MRTSTILRRGTVAALVPALLIAGTVTANAAEVSASEPSTTASNKESVSLPQLSSGGTLELFRLGSSLLGIDRPDFSDLLASQSPEESPAAGTQTTPSANAGTAEVSQEGNLPTGINAVKRVAAQEEEKAGHKLFELDTYGNKNIHVRFAETFDQQKDAPALEALAKAAEDNGITLTADR